MGTELILFAADGGTGGRSTVQYRIPCSVYYYIGCTAAVNNAVANFFKKIVKKCVNFCRDKIQHTAA